MGVLNVQAAEDHLNKASTDTQEAIVPAEVLERLGRPDVTYTFNGIYEKTQLPVSNFHQDEIVYDTTKTNEETKVIIDYDSTYIKISDN